MGITLKYPSLFVSTGNGLNEGDSTFADPASTSVDDQVASVPTPSDE